MKFPDPDALQASLDRRNRERVAAMSKEPTFMDNPPACGAPKNWKWGYLPCGCSNDGFGRHRR